MPKLFSNFNADPRLERQALASKYNAARMNLILVVAFTVINLITLAFGDGSYFLFSANMPYMITFYGMFLCGKLPEEYYEGLEGMFFLDNAVFVACIVVSLLILAVYGLCWFFSKNGKVRWLKTALILFSIDTVVMLFMGDISSMIFDIIFHAWVIYILVSGIIAHKKLRAMPEEEQMIEAEFTEINADAEPAAEVAEEEAPAEAEEAKALSEPIAEEVAEEPEFNMPTVQIRTEAPTDDNKSNEES